MGKAKDIAEEEHAISRTPMDSHTCATPYRTKELTGARIQLLRDLVIRLLELIKQVGADGEEVDTCEGLDLADL